MSGLRAASSTCTRNVHAASPLSGHQRKRPFDKRFVASQIPACRKPKLFDGSRPAGATTQNRQPENGSTLSLARRSGIGQRIDALAEVDGFHGNQYPYLWCDLPHPVVRGKQANQFGQFAGRTPSTPAVACHRVAIPLPPRNCPLLCVVRSNHRMPIVPRMLARL